MTNIKTSQTNVNFEEGFSEENDIFKRKPFADALNKIIDGSNAGLVLGLDAKWGEGKSTFLRMWQKQNHKDEGIRIVYFDAFANDYQSDPFLAIVSEFYEEFTGTDQNELLDIAAKAGKALLRAGVKIGVKAGTAGLVSATDLADHAKDVSDAVSSNLDSVIKNRIQNSKKDKQVIQNFRSNLESSAEKLNHGKLIFVIDELDRCRPDFALEIIEVVKHLFSVPGITFLLSMNRDQLTQSIHSRYGISDAETYLHKFVDLWISLPSSNVAMTKERTYALDLYDRLGMKRLERRDVLIRLFEFFKSSPRDIERVVSSLLLSYYILPSEDDSYYEMMIAVYCFYSTIKPKSLNKILNKNKGPKKVDHFYVDFLGFSSPSAKNVLIKDLLEYVFFDVSAHEIDLDSIGIMNVISGTRKGCLADVKQKMIQLKI